MTARRLQVLRLLAKGRTRDGIAAELFLTRNSVNVHVRHLMEILGARTRPHVVAQGYRLGHLGPYGSEPESEPDIRATVNRITAVVALFHLPRAGGL